MSKAGITMIMFGIFVSCDLGTCKSQTPVSKPNKGNEKMVKNQMLKIENVRTKAKKLTFEYEIENKLKNDIWVCNDISVTNDLTVQTKVRDGTLLISLRFDLPHGIFLEEPIVGRYIRLPTGRKYRGNISLNLPIESRSPISVPDVNSLSSIIEAEHIIFEVEYFMDDLSGMVLEAMEKCDPNSEKEEELFACLIAGVNEGNDLLNVVCVPDMWKEELNERSLKAEIKGLKIPCYFIE